MMIKILAFAQARETFGFSEKEIEYEPMETARELITRVSGDSSFQNLRVAVDCDFRGWDEPIGEAVEIALIPPVSGG
ncbi:MoaD/ThiS family protein [Luteolibacter sp. AS25]|uniref:MoaD/ThiS family protein n=1 Tax=Luteolibacter sp. AS25 TaxID=3135776 RepID=UPI00398ABE86